MLLFNGYGVSGGDGCTTLCMYLMPLNYTQKWLKGKCYVYFTTIKNELKKTPLDVINEFIVNNWLISLAYLSLYAILH